MYFFATITAYHSLPAKQQALANWAEQRFANTLVCTEGIKAILAEVEERVELANAASKRGKRIELWHTKPEREHLVESREQITAGVYDYEAAKKPCFILTFTKVEATYISDGLGQPPSYYKAEPNDE